MTAADHVVRAPTAQGIRPYEPEDARQVLELHRRRFLHNRPVDPRNRAYLENHFAKTLFESPWSRDDCRSLVYQTAGGDIAGFLGVVPRAMTFDGTPIRVAIATAFMVDPASRPAGIALLRQLLRGTQDLTLTDGATDHTRRILEPLRFRAVPAMSMNWFRVFRPTQMLLDRFTRTPTRARRSLARAGRPVCSLIDRPIARVRELGTSVAEPEGVRSRPVDVPELLGLIARAAERRRLAPVYDERSLRWVLDIRRSAEHRGTFAQMVVERSDGSAVGWYLGHVKVGGTSEIVQLGADDDRSADIVLARAISDCKQQGSALVQGRMEARLLRSTIVNECFTRPAAWMLAHSRNAEIVDAFTADDVFCSPLENEQPW